MGGEKYIYNNYFDINRNKVEYSWSMSNFHNHRSYEIYFLEKGSRKMLVQDRVYNISEGDILLISPNILHRSMNCGPHTRINIVFSDEFLDSYFTYKSKKYLTSCFDKEFIRLNDDEKKEFIFLFKKLSDECKNNKEYFITVSEILELFITAAEHGIEYDKLKENTFSQKTNSVIDLINKDYKTISTIDEIANACYINKSYMCRLFKKETGMTVFEYLNNIKIQNACELMRYSDKSMTDIAISCGFSSISYFSSFFKEVMKCTPTQFKKKFNIE